MTKLLSNFVSVITGGSSGIGFSIAKLFKQHGSSIVIFGRNLNRLENTRIKLGGNTLAVCGDVQNVSDLDALFTQIKNHFGQINSLIVNAGEGTQRLLSDIDERYFDEVSNINFKGAFFTAQKAIPLLREGSSIIFISSAAGTKGLPQLAVYSAAKAAVRSLARSMSVELAYKNIRVNSLSPGGVNTPFIHKDGLSNELLKKSIEDYSSLTPLNRLATPDEIASAALFLASNNSSYMTGADLAIDGGYAQV